MNKVDIGRKITELIRDDDKEKAYSLLQEISNYKSSYVREHLKFTTPIYDEDISIGSSQHESFFRVKNVTLVCKLSDKKILVLKKQDDQSEEIDSIYYQDGEAICNSGKFSVEKVDTYIVDTFKALF